MTTLTSTTGAATNFSIDIKGGNYKATIGKDGWAIYDEVPIFGFVPKGEKGAPQDIDAEYMQRMVSFSQKDYQGGNFASPIHKGHHKSLAIEDPEFLGFFLPKRVGFIAIDGKESPVIFARLKLKPSAFERAKNGELPYFSPEVDWETGKFMSLASLDSNPPHFKFPMFTTGEVTVDATAKFEAELKEPKVEAIEEKTEKCCSHCGAYSKKFGAKFQERLMTDQVAAPPKPIEPSEGAPKVTNAQMEAQAKKLAEFEAKAAIQEDKLAKLEKVNAERDAKDKAKGIFEKALSDLRGYQFGESVKKALFAAASESEEKVAILVGAFKEGLTKEPPRTLEEAIASSVSPSDPALSKFQKDSPERQAKAAQFLAEYREIKKAMKGYSLSAEAHVELEMRKLTASVGGNQ